VVVKDPTPTGTVNCSDRPLSLTTVRVASSPLPSASIVQEMRVPSMLGVMLWMFPWTRGP
jgi:hypothetical protein